ncbi:NERD domain-containing protein [Bacillus sp. T33-2]|uniref:NERD domain-containing protein n=1 Tax=Bacillus sp. T33-2 TaxID=2054168 RepID=UPI0015E06C95|nr:NERD domain-containing protein [Bacillus sp. T33-2]
MFLAVMIALSWYVKLNYPTIRGRFGEKQVSNLLNNLDDTKYILLNDLYIPKENGQTTQIDHVLVSHKGLFVIETKNYKGWITGSEYSQYWTQHNYKRQDKLYNPIWQNVGHIKALKEYLGDILNDVPVHSIIVFSKQATLKFKEPFKKATVIKMGDLLSTIEDEGGAGETVSNFKRHKIKQLLSVLYVKDKKTQKELSKKHIADIKNDMKVKNSKVLSNICPRCGSALVSRKGRKGEFKGCSSFPKCRFTA